MRDKLNYAKYVELRDMYESIVNRFANIRMIMFIVMIVSFILKYYYYEFLFSVVFVVSLIIFFIMVIVHDKYFKIYDYYVKYVLVMDKYVARENGEWKKFSDKGEDFLDDNKMYLSDLDIVGDCSLFQYLSVCKTLGGREKLISKLSNFQSEEKELVGNQKFIEELSSDRDFCIKFQVMMDSYGDKQVYLFKNSSNFRESANNVFKDFVIGIVASIICVILFVLGIIKVIPMEYFYGMFLFNVVVASMYAYVYRNDFVKLDKLVNLYGKLIDVFELVGNYKATSVKMKGIVKRANGSLVARRKLKRLDELNSLRNNLLSNFLLNGLLCFNLIVMYYYSLFINRDFERLVDVILDIEELEASISLAGIGIVKRDKCMPVYSERQVLRFDSLKHPLIDESVCVSNSFTGKIGVNIITGSNMGGKTTFLRTIGINLILMQAGSYVCADNFMASYFKIFTSMRIRDDVNKGISTFYGELLRIKDMLEYNGQGNMLVLIDEIFKGTNYNDRMYGAKEVVRKLNNKKTIAFITTHDFELCESDNISNFHVREEYEGDKIVFDYKVRDGKCVSTNAKYLMEKLGIVNKM